MEGDFVHKRCMRDNSRYADLINGVVFYGKQVIKPDTLKEVSEQTGIDKPVNRRYKKRKKEKWRDVVKKVSFGVNFMVIGVEGQSRTDYLMPLRNLSYEVMEYEAQAAKIRKEVREKGGNQKEEFLSGFRRSDKLQPCVIFLMYYGKEPWDGALELNEILNLEDIPEELRKYINNYQVHIIDVRRMQNTNVFQTDLKQIFEFLGCAEDMKKLRELVLKDKAYQDMSEEAYDLIMEYSNSENMISMKNYQREDGRINMCKGLEDWAMEERTAGREEGREEGKVATQVDNLRNVMKNLGISIEQAMQILMIPEGEQRLYHSLLEQKVPE